jgi:hypothetical protein
VYVGDLESKERDRLPGIAAEVRYSDGPAGGHLVFIRDGALIAQPFDVDTLQTTGESFPDIRCSTKRPCRQSTAGFSDLHGMKTGDPSHGTCFSED